LLNKHVTLLKWITIQSLKYLITITLFIWSFACIAHYYEWSNVADLLVQEKITPQNDQWNSCNTLTQQTKGYTICWCHLNSWIMHICNIAIINHRNYTYPTYWKCINCIRNLKRRVDALKSWNFIPKLGQKLKVIHEKYMH